MSSSIFQRLDEAAASGGRTAMFETLTRVLRAEKSYAQLHAALLMQKRHELGIPLHDPEAARHLPDEVQFQAENEYIRICREVGEACLQDGNLRAAWEFFQAIGEPWLAEKAIEEWAPEAPVTATTEGAPAPSEEGPRDRPEGSGISSEAQFVIDLALKHGAHPRKGFELTLSLLGRQPAIEAFDQVLSAPRPVWEDCGRLLVEDLHAEIGRRLRDRLRARGDAPPEDANLRDLLARWETSGEGLQPVVDEAQLRKVLEIAVALADPSAIESAVQLAEYGRLSGTVPGPTGPSPFEDLFADVRIYLLALQGTGVDGAVRFFTRKTDQAYPGSQERHLPAEALVRLLWRVGRTEEALKAHRRHLGRGGELPPTVPSLLELCRSARRYDELLDQAREKNDPVAYASGLLQREDPTGGSGR